MSNYKNTDKIDWFIERMSAAWFSRMEIVELAATEFPDISGKVLNGTIGQYWSDCVNSKWSTWKTIRARGLRVVENGGKRHIEKDHEASTSRPKVGSFSSRETAPVREQREVDDMQHASSDQKQHVDAVTDNFQTHTRELWNSNNQELWEQYLRRYWSFVKPYNLPLEKEMAQLDASIVKAMDPQHWYDFLLEKYFRWKYTAPNRYASTTRALRTYEAGNGLSALHETKERLFAFDRDDILQGITLAKSIRGLGTAGASGLLAVLFPRHFGTVDQFAVKALAQIPELPERELVGAMNPECLVVKEGVILIKILRRKALELNRVFSTDNWTPRKIDMVLWTCAR